MAISKLERPAFKKCLCFSAIVNQILKLLGGGCGVVSCCCCQQLPSSHDDDDDDDDRDQDSGDFCAIRQADE